MNVDLSREEVERIIKRLNDTTQCDLIETLLVQKLQAHFPPIQSGTGDLDVVRKYQQFAQR